MELRNNLNVLLSTLLVMVMSVIIGSYIAYESTIPEGYELLFLLPFSFGICFALFLAKTLVTKGSVFLWTFTVFAGVRYLVLPVLMVVQGMFSGYAYVPPQPDSIRTGLLLMVYELVVSSVVIKILFSKRTDAFQRLQSDTVSVDCSDGNLVYWLFIALSLFMLVLKPSALWRLSFFTDFSYGRTAGESRGFIELLTTHFLILSKLLLFFIVIKKCRVLYNKTRRNIYVIFSLIMSIFNIGIFVGINRKQIVMNAISSLNVLRIAFPKKRRMITILILALAFVIVFQLTAFRFSATTAQAISKLLNRLGAMLQVYFSGPYNMALAVETRLMFSDSISFKNYLYDLGRPFFGIGYFLKQTDMLISTDYFNHRVSVGGLLRSDQIIPITGQGLLHFGYVLSPAYLVIAIILGFYFEKKLKEELDFEKQYMYCLFCVMLGQAMGVNMIIITNVMTFQGVMFLVIHSVNKRVSVSRKSNRKMVNQ